MSIALPHIYDHDVLHTTDKVSYIKTGVPKKPTIIVIVPYAFL